MYGVIRETMKVGVIYVEPNGEAWFTPDGIGCYFYDSESEAIADYAVTDSHKIVYLDIASDLD